MTQKYPLLFDLISHTINDRYGHNQVVRVTGRETSLYYFIWYNNEEIKVKKLPEPSDLGAISVRFDNKAKFSTSSKQLYPINTDLAKKIHHQGKCRAIANKVENAITSMVRNDPTDPKLQEIAKILGLDDPE